jgi:hypothetical protein
MAWRPLTAEDFFVKDCLEELRRRGGGPEEGEVRRRCGERWAACRAEERAWFRHRAKQERRRRRREEAAGQQLGKVQGGTKGIAGQERRPAHKLSLNSHSSAAYKLHYGNVGWLDKLEGDTGRMKEKEGDIVKTTNVEKDRQRRIDEAKNIRDRVKEQKNRRREQAKEEPEGKKVEKEREVDMDNVKSFDSGPRRSGSLPAFHWYSQAERARVHQDQPDLKAGAVTRQLCQEWAGMTVAQRARYADGLPARYMYLFTVHGDGE